jgi:hypothetical protein
MDSSFGDGKQSFIFPGESLGDIDDKTFGAVLQRDGKIVLVGHTHTQGGMKMACPAGRDVRLCPRRSRSRRHNRSRSSAESRAGSSRSWRRAEASVPGLLFADSQEVIGSKPLRSVAPVPSDEWIPIDLNGDGVADAAVLTARKENGWFAAPSRPEPDASLA